MCYNKVKLKYSEVNKVFKLMHGNDSGAVSTRYFFSAVFAIYSGGDAYNTYLSHIHTSYGLVVFILAFSYVSRKYSYPLIVDLLRIFIPNLALLGKKRLRKLVNKVLFTVSKLTLVISFLLLILELVVRYMH